MSLHTELYFRANPTSEKAYVLAVHHSKVTVLVPKFGIEGTIWLTDEHDRGLLAYDPEAHVLTYSDPSAASGPISVQVFDAVTVYICVKVAADTSRPSVKVFLTSPPLGVQPPNEGLAQEPQAPAAKEAEPGPSPQKKRKVGRGSAR